MKYLQCHNATVSKTLAVCCTAPRSSSHILPSPFVIPINPINPVSQTPRSLVRDGLLPGLFSESDERDRAREREGDIQ